MVSDIVSKVASSSLSNESTYNIIDFSEKLVNINLYPMQRVILKSIFGVKLSDNIEEPVIIRDEFNDKVIYEFYSEYDVIQFLYENKHLNTLDIREGKVFNFVEFFMGRRGTKTTMNSLISSYFLYRLESLESPHEYFNVIPQSEISITITSNNVKNAMKQNSEIGNIVYGTKWFNKFLVSDTYSQEGFVLKTKKEIMTGNNALGKLRVSVFAASPSVRGSNNIVSILDEFAHYIDSDKSTKSDPLDKKVYEALTPSVAGFTNPDGTPAGLIMVSTSPNGKKGEAYVLYEESFGNDDVIMFNMPSFWVKHDISSSYLKSQYRKDHMVYAREFLAKFVSKKGSYILVPEKVYACEDVRISNNLTSGTNSSYIMSLDPALASDNFVVSMGHWSDFMGRNHVDNITDESYKGFAVNVEDKVFVVDFIKSFTPDGGSSLDPDEVFDFIIKVIKKYNVQIITSDTWGKDFIIPALKKRGVKDKLFKIVNPTPKTNSDIATMFRSMIDSNKIYWSPNAIESYGYGGDDGEAKLVTFSEEVIDLTQTVNGRLIKVEAPSGKHDDRFSAVSKMLYVAIQELDHLEKTREVYKRKSASSIAKHNKNILKAMNRRIKK